MDPNATLDRIAAAFIAQDLGESDAACRDLREWIQKGGFEPDWSRVPQCVLTRYQDTAARLESGDTLIAY